MYSNTVTLDKEAIVDECLTELMPIVVELNLSQLSHGTNAKGGKFRKYRNAVYARKKSAMNPTPGLGNPDLNLTGKFWKEFKASIMDQSIEWRSEDSKATWLEEGTSRMQAFEDIYGLIPGSMGILRTEFLILFNDKLRVKIGLQ